MLGARADHAAGSRTASPDKLKEAALLPCSQAPAAAQGKGAAAGDQPVPSSSQHERSNSSSTTTTMGTPAATGTATPPLNCWHRRALSLGAGLNNATSFGGPEASTRQAPPPPQVRSSSQNELPGVCQPPSPLSPLRQQGTSKAAAAGSSSSSLAPSSASTPRSGAASQPQGDSSKLDQAALLMQQAPVQGVRNGYHSRPALPQAPGGSGSFSAPVSMVASPVVSPVRMAAPPPASAPLQPPLSLGRPAAVPLQVSEGQDDAPDLERFLQAATPLVVPPASGVQDLTMVSRWAGLLGGGLAGRIA